MRLPRRRGEAPGEEAGVGGGQTECREGSEVGDLVQKMGKRERYK